MISIKSIVLDVDALAVDHPALDHAYALANRCGARLTVVDVLPPVPERARSFVTPGVESEIVEDRRQRLEAIASRLSGVTVKTELLRGRPASAVVEEAVRSEHDVVVRSHGRDIADPPRPYGAIDMELLRTCPCPVWLIDRRSVQRGAWRIVAAVHADGADATEQALNHRILDWALTLRDLGGGDLTILQAWIPYGASLLRARMAADEFEAFLHDAQASEQRALDDLLRPYADRLAGVSVQLQHGEPHHVIVDFVESHGIDIVVMGTVARSGIAGVVMGNTAERVLRQLRGSVFAVKPQGFESPLVRSRK
jgi:nucleotide-binding universal stress UspA family protein